ncbi:hypothetical protein [Kitasatospora sp. GP82]|uniref:hypothetical protein n=1 Tax=Kitasatospora sp. GP82 TaxID=3035089 RepID=UPI002473DFE8|nr:hypothetical protein [Kitasatospora sp. GP82]MDH6123138.1 hypothetical protein [Kitasatospora sp. GP82]
MAVRSAQLWGAVAGMSAALAVVVGYLIDGERMVWAVAAAETLVFMAWVGRRFRGKVVGRAVAHGPDAAHCERCRRARARLEHR